MTVSELEQSLRGVIARVGQVPGNFSTDADLYNDVGLDSFRMVEIFTAIEKDFGVTISEDDYIGLRSLSQFVSFLQQRSVAT